MTDEEVIKSLIHSDVSFLMVVWENKIEMAHFPSELRVSPSIQKSDESSNLFLMSSNDSFRQQILKIIN